MRICYVLSGSSASLHEATCCHYALKQDSLVEITAAEGRLSVDVSFLQYASCFLNAVPGTVHANHLSGIYDVSFDKRTVPSLSGELCHAITTRATFL